MSVEVTHNLELFNDTPFSTYTHPTISPSCVVEGTECGVVGLLQLRMMSDLIDATLSCIFV